jgi:hypothetical protein
MRPTPSPLRGMPAAILELLPPWALLLLAGVSILLAGTQVIVTQIIRLRASARITRSQDALRVLEIEDLARQRDGPN